jgi:predicted transcriptional regulator
MKGQKRDPKDLAALVERLFDFIKANPGRRVEQIKEALGLKTSALTLPIRKLIAAKRITAMGLRRATTYSPA